MLQWERAIKINYSGSKDGHPNSFEIQITIRSEQIFFLKKKSFMGENGNCLGGVWQETAFFFTKLYEKNPYKFLIWQFTIWKNTVQVQHQLSVKCEATSDRRLSCLWWTRLTHLLYTLFIDRASYIFFRIFLTEGSQTKAGVHFHKPSDGSQNNIQDLTIL